MDAMSQLVHTSTDWPGGTGRSRSPGGRCISHLAPMPRLQQLKHTSRTCFSTTGMPSSSSASSMPRAAVNRPVASPTSKPPGAAKWMGGGPCALTFSGADVTATGSVFLLLDFFCFFVLANAREGDDASGSSANPAVDARLDAPSTVPVPVASSDVTLSNLVALRATTRPGL